MSGPRLCKVRLWEPDGPQCVLNQHPDDRLHGWTTNVSDALLREALARALRLGWRSISVSRLHDLRMGDASRLPPRSPR